jgi:hypothetical protein
VICSDLDESDTTSSAYLLDGDDIFDAAILIFTPSNALHCPAVFGENQTLARGIEKH